IFGEAGQLVLRAPGYVSFAPPTLHLGLRYDARLRRVRIPRRLLGGVDLDARDPGFNVALALGALVQAVQTGDRFRPDFQDATHLHEVIDDIGRGRLHTLGCPPPPRRRPGWRRR